MFSPNYHSLMYLFFSKRFGKTCFSLAFFTSFLILAGITGGFDDVKALKLIYESFMSNEQDKLEFTGDFAGGQFGSSLASGDFNNDGIDDLVVGAPFASLNDKQWNGAVRIIFGNLEGKNAHVDFYGENSGDQLGTSLAVGDFNNDFFDDIAVGAYNAQSNGLRPGKAYVIFGNKNLTSQTDTQNGILSLAYNQSISEFTGKDSGDQFGVSLFSIDVNSDGLDDLLVGAPFAWGPDFYKSGAVYIYFGSRDSLSLNPNYSLYAKSQNERFGSAITGGHIISTSANDIVIGAYLANNEDVKQTGKVYVYKYNSNAFVERFSSISINDSIENGWFGFAVAAGNLNGDEYDDLAISSFPYKSDRQNAKVSIFYGGKKINKKPPDIIIGQPEGEAFLGASVLLKDLNFDTKADIILGAPGIGKSKSTEEGSIYIIYSSNSNFNDRYDIQEQDYDAVIHGKAVDDWFGASINVLDFNNDGYKDLASSARYADKKKSINNGRVSVLFGKEKPRGSLKSILDINDQEVTRGEFLKLALDKLDIRNKKSDYLKNCYDYRDFCLFNFMAMSSFNDIKLEPDLVLYPDVLPGSGYYEDVNISTMLGLVNGYLNEDASPFHPDLPITRIQALKVVLSAADLVPPKYQFELIAMLGSQEALSTQKTYFADVDPKVSSVWWQPRYVNFAVENNIIDKSDFFRPNDNITAVELEDLLNRTNEKANS